MKFACLFLLGKCKYGNADWQINFKSRAVKRTVISNTLQVWSRVKVFSYPIEKKPRERNTCITRVPVGVYPPHIQQFRDPPIIDGLPSTAKRTRRARLQGLHHNERTQ